jgi:hypothetical protein
MDLARVLLGKTDQEIALIKSQAETVFLSLASSMSALSQNTSFSREDAGVVLSAVAYVEKLRADNPTADASSLPAETMGFQARRQPVNDPQGTTWGC